MPQAKIRPKFTCLFCKLLYKGAPNDQQRIKKELFLFLIHDPFTIVFCFDFTSNQPSVSVYFNDLDWRNQRDLLEYNPDQPVDSEQKTKTGLKDLIHISTSSIPFFELF